MNELKLAEEIDNFLLLTKYNECNSLVRKNHSYTPDFNDYMNTINNFPTILLCCIAASHTQTIIQYNIKVYLIIQH